jgi:glycosyltransferase involved in cell wall biosynthesis
VLHIVDMRRNPFHPANAVAVGTVSRLIRQVRPDVVHGHSSVGGAVGRLAARVAAGAGGAGAGGAGVGAGLGGVGVDGAGVDGAGVDGRGRAACVYTANGVMSWPPAVALERALGRLTDRFVATSATEAQRVLALGLVPESRVTVIPNGITLAAPDPPSGHGGDVRARFGLPAGTPLVATVARVASQKAPEQFVRACAAVARRRPAVHFLLVGLGPQQRRVDREVAALGLRARFHQVPHLSDAAAVMDQFDVFVLLSRYEGGPYAPLEAMRAGVPVVLSDVAGNHDTVEHQVSGLLVPFGAPHTAATAIVRLLDDRRTRASVVAGAHARLVRDFDVRLMGERLAALYSDLAARGTSATEPPSGPELSEAEFSGAVAGVTRRRTRRLPQARSGHSSNSPDATASQNSS